MGPGTGSLPKADGETVTAAYCHETAVVDGARRSARDRGSGISSMFRGGATIGSNVVLGQNVFVGNRGQDRRRLPYPEQRLALRQCRPRGGCLLRSLDGVHERREPESIRQPQGRICRHARQARRVAGRELHDRLRRHHRRICVVAAGAVVTKDVAPYSLVAGVPGRPIGWVSRSGRRLELPVEGDGVAECPETGERYELRGGQLTPA